MVFVPPLPESAGGGRDPTWRGCRAAFAGRELALAACRQLDPSRDRPWQGFTCRHRGRHHISQICHLFFAHTDVHMYLNKRFFSFLIETIFFVVVQIATHPPFICVMTSCVPEKGSLRYCQSTDNLSATFVFVRRKSPYSSIQRYHE